MAFQLFNEIKNPSYFNLELSKICKETLRLKLWKIDNEFLSSWELQVIIFYPKSFL